jgi:hypothetical protein
MTQRDPRTTRLLAALRSPEFAVRLLQQASPAARAEVLRRWNDIGASSLGPARQVLAPTVLSPSGRPALAKCAPLGSGNTRDDALAAQLAAFAKSVRRVG